MIIKHHAEHQREHQRPEHLHSHSEQHEHQRARHCAMSTICIASPQDKTYAACSIVLLLVSQLAPICLALEVGVKLTQPASPFAVPPGSTRITTASSSWHLPAHPSTPGAATGYAERACESEALARKRTIEHREGYLSSPPHQLALALRFALFVHEPPLPTSSVHVRVQGYI
jgi:hypothetical protein